MLHLKVHFTFKCKEYVEKEQDEKDLESHSRASLGRVISDNYQRVEAFATSSGTLSDMLA
jgi:hypothetical protein